jgi:hypothetical protein
MKMPKIVKKRKNLNWEYNVVGLTIIRLRQRTLNALEKED